MSAPVRDNIREALAEIIRDSRYPSGDDEFLDLHLADAILNKFLVAPRDQAGLCDKNE